MDSKVGHCRGCGQLQLHRTAFIAVFMAIAVSAEAIPLQKVPPPPPPSFDWTTVHHDVRNTGRANFEGPADSTHICTKTIGRVGSEFYYDTGSVSLNNSELYTGTDGPTLEVWNVETFKQATIHLKSSSDQGTVVSPPTIWGEQGDDGFIKEELVFVGTAGTDGGWVYALRTAECSNNDRAEGSCLHWKKSIGPVVAPIRVTATKSDQTGVVIASSSENVGRENGQIWGFEVSTGDPKWAQPFNTTFTINSGNASVTKWYGMPHVPAVGHCLEDTVAFFGYGPVIRGLDADTGKEVVEPFALLEANGGVVEETVSSSITLSEGTNCETTLTFQTEVEGERSALWTVQVDMITSGNTEFIARLQPMWRCEYDHKGGEKGQPIVSACDHYNNNYKASQPDFEALANEAGVDVESYLISRMFQPKRQSVFGNSPMRLGTPAIVVDEKEVEDRFVFTQFQYLPDDPAAVVAVWKSNGSVIWDFQGGGNGVKFGTSVSSPAVDQAGNIYVASDAHDKDNNKVPALFALNINGELQWFVQIDNIADQVGFISPVVAEGPEREKRVYMATFDDHMVISEGCPTNGTDVCSGNGKCLCENAKPVCECDLCYLGEDCAVFATCDGFGNCRPEKGGCVCENDYERVDRYHCKPCDFCHSGTNCSDVQDCDGHGICDNEKETCYCETGWYGRFCDKPMPTPGVSPSCPPAPTCSAVPTPTRPSACSACPDCPTPSANPAPNGPNQSNSGSQAGDIAAGVGIPLLIVGFCVSILVCHRVGCFRGSRFGNKLEATEENIGEKLGNLRSSKGNTSAAAATSGSAFATSGSSSYGTTSGGSKKGAYTVL